MLQSQPPVFGKRNRQRLPVAHAPVVASGGAASATAPADGIRPDHAAFFAAVRSELSERTETETLVVPWSFKAASLAGLAVGCALAGFNVTGQAGQDRFEVVAGVFGVQVDTTHLLPAMIALGLFAGARVATATVLCVHAVLTRTGATSHLAYLCGGLVASAAFAILMQVVTGHPPAHGWIVELAAGGGAGLCYRAFAGAHPRPRQVKPRKVKPEPPP